MQARQTWTHQIREARPNDRKNDPEDLLGGMEAMIKGAGGDYDTRLGMQPSLREQAGIIMLEALHARIWRDLKQTEDIRKSVLAHIQVEKAEDIQVLLTECRACGKRQTEAGKMKRTELMLLFTGGKFEKKILKKIRKIF